MAECDYCGMNLTRFSGTPTPEETRGRSDACLTCGSCGRTYCFDCLSGTYKGIQSAAAGPEATSRVHVALLRGAAREVAVQGRLLCPHCKAKSVGY